MKFLIKPIQKVIEIDYENGETCKYYIGEFSQLSELTYSDFYSKLVKGEGAYFIWDVEGFSGLQYEKETNLLIIISENNSYGFEIKLHLTPQITEELGKLLPENLSNFDSTIKLD